MRRLLAAAVLALAACAPPAGPPEPGAAALERLGLGALPTTRLAVPADPKERIGRALRNEIFPAVRRDAPLELCVDFVERADLAALGRALDGAGESRSERAALIWEALAAEERLRLPFRTWLETRAGAADVSEFRALHRICFTGSERLAKEAAERDDVAHVQHVPRVPETMPEPLRFEPEEALAEDHWALPALGAPAAWERGARGGGTVVAVLDSGVSAEHPALRGRSVGRFEVRPPRGRGGGHGLQVLAAAVGAGGLGVAPEARWAAADPIPEDVQDPRVFAACIEWLMREVRPDVVVAPWDTPQGAAWAPGLQRAFEALRTAGAAVVFPAGNTGPAPGRNRPPGNLSGLAPDGAPAFSVAGVDREGAPYALSNRGPSAHDGSSFPQVAAPAVRLAVADPLAAREAVTGEGTSFASGFAAGALAVLLGTDDGLTGPEAERRLRETARDLGAAGRDEVFGHGLIDLAAATASR